MTIRRSILMLVALAAAWITAPAADDEAPELPRLTEIERFPEEYRGALRTVIAELKMRHWTVGEYFAKVISKDANVFSVFLKHQSHPPYSPGVRGDLCGRCCILLCDRTTGAVLQIQKVR